MTNKTRTLQHRTNNAFDTVILVENGAVIGAWAYRRCNMPQGQTNPDWDSPGDLDHWSATSIEDGQTEPGSWGELVETKNNNS